MARRTTRADTEAAANQASEAARVLAQRSHESRSDPTETSVEPTTPVEGSTSPDRIEKLLNGRPSVQSREEIIKRRGLDVEPEEPKAEKVEPKVEPEPEAKTEVVAEAPPIEPVKVKQVVDGDEYEVEQAEIDAAGGERAWRRDKASELRLAKAKEITEEARKTQAQTAQLVQALLQQSQPAKKVEPTDDQFIQEKIDVIRFGTPAESATALREIMARGQQKVDPDAIVSQATNRINNQLAVTKFRTDYSDVLSNPTLTKLAISLEREYASQLPQGQIVDWEKFYSKIGNEIRAIAPQRQSQPPAKTDTTNGNPSQPSVKEERKASITTIPTAAARAARPEPEKEMSPEEERKAWIASQKKSRGQG